MNKKKTIFYADDDIESIGTLFKLRISPLILGLFLGIVITFVTSSFEEVLAHNVQVAFFLPFIVYIADAIGTQTETIYSRDLKTGHAKFTTYLKKELALGLIFGVLFSIFSGAIAFIWLHNYLLALSVTIATFLAVTISPVLAVLTTELFQVIHKDPATSAGPISTVLQDTLSVVIYGTVCSLILLP